MEDAVNLKFMEGNLMRVRVSPRLLYWAVAKSGLRRWPLKPLVRKSLRRWFESSLPNELI